MGMEIGLGTQLDQSSMEAFGCLANQRRILKSLRITNQPGPETGQKASLNDQNRIDIWDATFTESLNRERKVASGRLARRK